MKTFILISFLFFVNSCNNSVDRSPFAERATLIKRIIYQIELNELISEAFSQHPDSIVIEDWNGAFWGANLMLRKDSLTINAIKTAIRKCPDLDYSFCRWALESANTLANGSPEVVKEMESFMFRVSDPKLESMTAHYLFNHEIRFKKIEERPVNLKKSNPIDFATTILTTSQEMGVRANKEIEKLINFDFPAENPVLFSFHRKNRNYPGLTIFRKADGTFLRDKDNKLEAVPQLARSISNMPGYLMNGNTPQGVMAITGTGFSENVFIGPTETLITQLPFEGNVSDFFPNKSDSTKWSEELYGELVPENYEFNPWLWEAFYAGKAGRTEIISHGTTINPEFYEDKSYYPNTPSLGCLTAYETWDSFIGKRTSSNQQKLIDLWKSLDSESGYFFVVDIDDQNRSVTLKEIEEIVQKAEKAIK